MLNGLALGLLYALIAVGLSLIFGVMEIINFGHGEFFMLGALRCASLTVMGVRTGRRWQTVIVTVVLFGFVLYEVALSLRKPTRFERSILVTLGLSMIIAT